MRIFLCVALALAAATFGFAGGETDAATASTPAPVTELSYLVTPGQPDALWPQPFVDQFTRETGIAVELVPLELGKRDHRTFSIDTMLAAGIPPNVYTDHVGTVARFFNEAHFRLNLADYPATAAEIAHYKPGVLAGYSDADGVYALPAPVSPIVMTLNLTLLEEAGYVYPGDDRWTVAEFLAMCAAVHRIEGAYCWGEGGLGNAGRGGNGGGESRWFGWLATFGAELYHGGAYDRTALDPARLTEALSFMKGLVDSGYAPDDMPLISGDDHLFRWGAGKIAAAAVAMGWDGYFVGSMVDQGVIAEPWDIAYVPFPHAPGVQQVPLPVQHGATVGWDSDDAAINAATAQLIATLHSAAGHAAQASLWNAISVRDDAVGRSEHPAYSRVNDLVNAHGLFDLGFAGSRFGWTLPVLNMRDLLDGKTTPREVARQAIEKLSTDLEG